MKKLLLLSALFIFACSNDDSNNDENTSSELIGTYSHIIGYEDEETPEYSFNWGCNTEFVEFTNNSFNQHFIDEDFCDPANLVTTSAPFQITVSGNSIIAGTINYPSSMELSQYFEFNISSGVLRTYSNFDEDASTTNWDILNVFQKN
jgi:hypothetical protein